MMSGGMTFKYNNYRGSNNMINQDTNCFIYMCCMEKYVCFRVSTINVV